MVYICVCVCYNILILLFFFHDILCFLSRQLQVSGVSDLASKGQGASDCSNVKMKGQGTSDCSNVKIKGQGASDCSNVKIKDEIDDSYQPDTKIRCLCGSSLESETLIKV